MEKEDWKNTFKRLNDIRLGYKDCYLVYLTAENNEIKNKTALELSNLIEHVCNIIMYDEKIDRLVTKGNTSDLVRATFYEDFKKIDYFVSNLEILLDKISKNINEKDEL